MKKQNITEPQNMTDLFRCMNAILIQALVIIGNGGHTAEECEILAKSAIQEARKIKQEFSGKEKSK